MKRILSIIATLLVGFAAIAQENKITWTTHTELAGDNEYRVIFTGKIAEGYHTYTLTDDFSATEIMDLAITGGELLGQPYEISKPVEELDEFGDMAKHYYNEIILGQNVKTTSQTATLTGTIFTNTCTGGACSANYFDFTVKVGATENAVMVIAEPMDTEVTEAKPVQITKEVGADAKRVQALLTNP